MNQDTKKILKNHIPTIKRLCDVFLSCLDAPDDIDLDEEKAYLLEVLDEIETNTTDSKSIIEAL